MGTKQFAELDWREQNPPIGNALLGRTRRCRSAIPLNWGASQIARERNSVLRVELRTVALAASHELSYHLTKRRRSIHMLYSGYAKVNPTGIESIDHLRPRRRPPLRHPL
jgi:hypothetical protein